MKMGNSNFVSSLRRLWPLALGALVLAGTACEALATQGALDAVETGREVRELEKSEIRPLEDELRALIQDEIEPLQDELEDLYFEAGEIKDTVLRPLWESQEDPWGPGGELFVAQQGFEARFQDVEQRYREIELEERTLQGSFNGGFDPYNSPETQALEDQRYELQRELDRLYRRGWDPVSEIYDEINFLSQGFNWSDPGTNDEYNEINNQINDLYNEANRLQQNVDGDSSALWNELDQINNELNNLYNWGRTPIDDLYRQIENEQNYLNESGSFAYDVSGDIATLEGNLAFLESQWDEILSGLWGSRDAVEADLNFILAGYDADIDALEAQISQLSSSDGSTETSPASGSTAELDALYAELQAALDAIAALKDAADAEIDVLISAEEVEVGPLNESLDDLDLQLIEVDDGTASTTALVLEIEIEINELIGNIGAIYQATDLAIEVIETDRDAAIAPHQTRVDELNAEIAELPATTVTTAVTLSDDNSAQVASLEGEISDLKLQRDIEAGPYYQQLAGIDQGIDEESSFWDSQIGSIRNEINDLQSQAGDGSAGVDDSFLRSLISQVEQMEGDYQDQINKFEGRRSELDQKVNRLSSEDPAQGIYEKIDELNAILFTLAEKSGADAQDNQRRLDQLQRQAYDMEQELQDKTRALEDQLWDLDDELQDFYRNIELSQRNVQEGSGAAFNELQARRFALDDERFEIETEMNELFNSFDGGRSVIEQEAKRLEIQLLDPIKIRVREIEIRLKDLRKEARSLERQIRDAEDFVDDRRRELENDVFSLLEGALAVGEALIEEGGLLDDGSLPGSDGLLVDDPTTDLTAGIDPDEKTDGSDEASDSPETPETPETPDQTEPVAVQ